MNKIKINFGFFKSLFGVVSPKAGSCAKNVLKNKMDLAKRDFDRQSKKNKKAEQSAKLLMEEIKEIESRLGQNFNVQITPSKLYLDEKNICVKYVRPKLDLKINNSFVTIMVLDKNKFLLGRHYYGYETELYMGQVVKTIVNIATEKR